jgi:phosphonate transport system substrate-binding protein
VHEAHSALVDYLSRALGREIKLETAKDQNAFWVAVTQQRYDIVHYNQMNYIESHDKYGYDVIAMNEEFGKSTLGAALVVRRDSGIEKVSDLRGKSVVFGGGPKAMVAYIGNVVLLKRAGLKKGDFKEEFSRNPANAIMAVYYKQADAGGAGDIGLKIQAVDEKIDTHELKMLAVGDQIPHLPWAVKRSLGSTTAQQVQAALLKLNDSPEGQTILKTAQLTGIRAATDADYDVVRQMIKEASE